MARRREVKMLPGALKAWREVRGAEWNPDGKPLSQKQLAIRAGVSPTLVAMIETGERQPSRLNAEDIATALKVDLDAIAFTYPDPIVDELASAVNQ